MTDQEEIDALWPKRVRPAEPEAQPAGDAAVPVVVQMIHGYDVYERDVNVPLLEEQAGCKAEPLVRQSDALAALAARDAEIAEQKEEIEALNGRLLALADRMEYRGNSVSFIYAKKDAYAAGIDAVFAVLKAHGIADGSTHMSILVDGALKKRDAEIDRLSKELGECQAGYQTMEREVDELRQRLTEANIRIRNLGASDAALHRLLDIAAIHFTEGTYGWPARQTHDAIIAHWRADKAPVVDVFHPDEPFTQSAATPDTEARVQEVMQRADEYMGICSQEDVASTMQDRPTRLPREEWPSTKARARLEAAIRKLAGEA